MMVLLIAGYLGGLIGFVLGAAWASRPPEEAKSYSIGSRLSY
jgi:hypothetical protein